jgi:hypothetical protein
MSLIVTTQVQCPACGARYVQKAHQAIDVSREPHLKEALLQGRFNLSICPQCGSQGLINLPFIYHDGTKSLFYLFLPMDLRATDLQQQQAVGALTRQFMDSLPAEERRGYMLQPKIYLSLQSLLDDILLADGITKEQLQAMRDRAALLQELLQIDTLDGLRQAVERNKERVDDTLFEVLEGWIAEATAQGAAETAQALMDLKQDLLQIVRPEEAAGQEAPPIEREELLEMLLKESDPERLRALVAVVRPLLDYQFFLLVADRIEAAQQSGNEIEAKRLSRLRQTLLELIEQLDAEARQLLERAATLLRQALSVPDPRPFLEERASQIDQAFFTVLELNLAAAEQRGDERLLAALRQLATVAMSVLEEKAPPEIRLINQLLRASSAERQELIRANKALVTDRLLAIMRQMRAGLETASRTGLPQQMDELISLVEAELQSGQGG